MYNILFVTTKPLEHSLVQHYSKQFYIYSSDTIDKAEGIIKHKEIDFLILSFNLIEHKRYKSIIKRLLSNNDMSLFVTFNRKNPRHSKKLSRLGCGIIINRNDHKRVLEFFEDNYSRARLNSFGAANRKNIEASIEDAMHDEETVPQVEPNYIELKALTSPIAPTSTLFDADSIETSDSTTHKADEGVLDIADKSGLVHDYVENKYSEDTSKAGDEKSILNVHSNLFNDFIQKADNISKNITDELEQNIAIESELIKQKYDAYSNKNNGFEDFFKKLNNDLSKNQPTTEKEPLDTADNSSPIQQNERETITHNDTGVAKEPLETADNRPPVDLNERGITIHTDVETAKEPLLADVDKNVRQIFEPAAEGVDKNIEPHIIPVNVQSILNKNNSSDLNKPLDKKADYKVSGKGYTATSIPPNSFQNDSNDDLFKIAIDKNILLDAISDSLSKDNLQLLIEKAIEEQLNLKINEILPSVAERLIKEELKKINNG